MGGGTSAMPAGGVGLNALDPAVFSAGSGVNVGAAGAGTTGASSVAGLNALDPEIFSGAGLKVGSAATATEASNILESAIASGTLSKVGDFIVDNAGRIIGTAAAVGGSFGHVRCPGAASAGSLPLCCGRRAVYHRGGRDSGREGALRMVAHAAVGMVTP